MFGYDLQHSLYIYMCVCVCVYVLIYYRNKADIVSSISNSNNVWELLR